MDDEKELLLTGDDYMQKPTSADDHAAQEDMQIALLEWEGREEWRAWRCSDMPAHYAVMLPPTRDAKRLLAAEKIIRQKMADDLKSMNNEANSPWIKQTSKPRLVDFTGLDHRELIKLGTEFSRMMGVHAAIKPGFHNHPDVKAMIAPERVQRTAEYVAHEHMKEIGKRYQAASSAFVAASNEDVDRDAGGFTKNGKTVDPEKVARLEAEMQKLQAEYEAAQAEVDRLKNDWEAAAQLVLDVHGDPIDDGTAQSKRVRKILGIDDDEPTGLKLVD